MQFSAFVNLATKTSALLPLCQIKVSVYFHLGKYYWKDFSGPASICTWMCVHCCGEGHGRGGGREAAQRDWNAGVMGRRTGARHSWWADDVINHHHAHNIFRGQKSCYTSLVLQHFDSSRKWRPCSILTAFVEKKKRFQMSDLRFVVSYHCLFCWVLAVIDASISSCCPAPSTISISVAVSSVVSMLHVVILGASTIFKMNCIIPSWHSATYQWASLDVQHTGADDQ